MRFPNITDFWPSKWSAQSRGKRPVRRSLGLGGDGDETELAEEFERAFAVRFTDEELKNCQIVGDMDELVWERLRTRYNQNGRCMSAMAFYALRRVLRPQTKPVRIEPSTLLRDLPISPKLLVNLLKKQEGLRTDFMSGYLADIGWYLQLGWLGLLWAFLFGPGDWALLSITAIILGLTAIGLDQGAFARGETVGDASRRLARQNFGMLADKGGRVTRQGVWEAVRQVAGDFQGLPVEEIGRETYFMSLPLWGQKR